MSKRSNAALAEREKAGITSERRKHSGTKPVNKAKRISRIFAGQLTDAATILLIAAAAVSAVVGAYSDALPIMLLAICNTAVNFIREYRSEKTLQRISEISGRTEGITTADTALLGECDRIGHILNVICFVGCASYLVISVLRGIGLAESFYISAALTVASVPQGIRAAYFISGAAAMERSLRAGAAICSYQTLERLASVGTLCIEKTGVLTEGYVSVSSLAVLSKTGFTEYEYSEAESRLTSGNSADGFYAWEDSSLSRILICAAVCNNAKRVRTDKQISGRNRGRRTYYDGDPLESALLRLCSSCGIERELLICEKLSERAFDRSDRYMTVTVREQHGRQVVYAKGAPEVISSLCSLSEGLQNGLDMLCEKYASSGMRLLAFCMNRGSGWELLGLAAFRDSIRPHSAEKVRRLRQLGISAVMLTGDHPLTAAAAASRAGILTPDSLAVTGDELDTMNDEQLYDNVRRIALASRTVPEQRERILSTLKSRGVVCAYAGDAPPESADVRISSADKTADIILSGGISSIAEAAAESRASLKSLLRTVCCMISAETALLLTAVSAAALGMPTIFNSTHLLIAALLCGSLPVLTLSAAPLTHSKGSEFREKIETLFGGNIADAVVRGVLSALCVLGCCSLMMSRGAALNAVQNAALATLVISRGAIYLIYRWIKKR